MAGTASAQVSQVVPKTIHSSRISLPVEPPSVNEDATFEQALENGAHKPVTIIFHQGNNGAKATVPNGALIKVILDDNAASTGFDWSFTSSLADVLEFRGTNNRRKASSLNLIGAPAKKAWVFTAISPGTTTLTFSLARPWEKEVAPQQVIHFDITVE